MSWPPEAAAVPLAPFRQDAIGPKVTSPATRRQSSDGCLRLELPAATLLRLLKTGQLSAADFRCLDCESRHCVWRLLLMSCVKTLHPEAGCDGRCERCERTKHSETNEPPEAVALLPYQAIAPAPAESKPR